MQIHIDTYPWGTEEIIWGHNPNQEYTLKLLKPKVGKAGCLSLQYHEKKCETWVGLKGIGWGLVIHPSNTVRTFLIYPEKTITHLPYTVHRLMGLTHDFTLAEASTPDAYAADKTIQKDVIRLHCVHGRPCSLPDVKLQKAIIKAIALTNEAIDCLNNGLLPPEKIIKID